MKKDKNEFIFNTFSVSEAMSINERSRQLAAEANEKAKEYHQARTTETAHSFEDLAMDQPLPRDHTDPGNSYVFRINARNYIVANVM